MTFVLGSGNFLLKRGPTRNVKDHALQALFPLPRGPCPTQELLRKFHSLGLPPLLFPALQVGRIRGGGSQGAPGVVSRKASSTPARPRSSEKGCGGGVSLDIRLLRASVSSAPSGAGEGEVARSQQTPPARAASSVASPHSSQHARRHDELREVSEDHFIARSSRASRSLYRGARKDRGARSRTDSSHDRGRRDLRIATTLGVCALVLGETGLDPLIDTALDVTGRGLLTATDRVDSVLVPQLVGELAVT